MVLDDSVLRRSDALREMMRFARAIVSDGTLTDSEAMGFRALLETNPDVRSLPAMDELVDVFTNYLHDGDLSDRERAILVDALERFGG